MRTHRTLLTLSSLLLAALAVAPPAHAAEPAGISLSASGWVVARQPSTSVYAPAAMDRGNSSGGGVRIERQGTGVYYVIWNGLVDATYGIVQATALGDKQRFCSASTWGSWDVSGFYADIRCYKRVNDPAHDNAAPADSRFAAMVVAEDAPVASTGRLAYAWTDFAASDGTPSEGYNYTSAGTKIQQVHLAEGSYRWTMPDLDLADGAMLVTTYLGAPRSCQIRDLGAASGDVQTTVDCVGLKGGHLDSNTDLLYLRRLTLEGYGGKPGAYVFADKPTTASYHPTTRSWSTAGKQATITRSAKGVYQVLLPGMPAGGAAIVTAWGTRNAPRSCQLGAIRTTGTPQRVTVRCFSMTGAPTDSRFTLAYAK